MLCSKLIWINFPFPLRESYKPLFIPQYDHTVNSIAAGNENCTILFIGCARISDRGGGIRHEISEKIWEYGFTSPGYQGGEKHPRSHFGTRIPDGLFDELMVNRSTGKMHGYSQLII